MLPGKQPTVVFFLGVLMLFHALTCISSDLPQMRPPMFIAHAGGAVNRQTYTNSLEALNTNYEKGFRFFEIDFSWTADEELVAAHDWDDAYQELFYVPAEMKGKVPTSAQFFRLKSKKGLTQLSLEDVLAWAAEKQDAVIVTDIKDKNLNALRKIRNRIEKYEKYIIPQAYSYQEYDDILKLGYKNIILTLYRMEIDPAEALRLSKNNSQDIKDELRRRFTAKLVGFSKKRSPFAVTMHQRVARSGVAALLHQNNTAVYVHTVNDIKLFDALRGMGIFGIYTDYLAPPSLR
jgi:glycerophosphoryl diester phosphodiesterase